MKTVKTVEPLGTSSLENAVEPPDARRRSLPEVTAEKVVRATLFPHANVPLLTPQLPLDEVMVKLEVVPESVYLARVCVDQTPEDSNPPMELPDSKAWIVALVGRVPGAPVVVVGRVPVVVGVGLPLVLGGYLIPEEGQDPAFGASIGTKVPSIIDPFKLKYHLI